MKSPGKALALVVLLGTLFIASCTHDRPWDYRTWEIFDSTPVPIIVDSTLAYGIPCQAPCWHNMTPGKTTLQEAKQAVAQLSTSEPSYHIQDNLPWQYDVYPLPDTVDGVIHIRIEDETVLKIKGSILFPYSLEALITQFGAPEGISISKDHVACNACEEWVPPRRYNDPEAFQYAWEMILLYPSQGLVFELTAPEESAGCICPEMTAAWFCYYEPVTMEIALEDDYLANLCFLSLAGLTEADLVAWHDFGGGY